MPKRRRAQVKINPANGRLYVCAPWTAPSDVRQEIGLKGIERWLTRWAKLETFDAGGRCLYLRRWVLGGCHGYWIYLHHWLSNDWARHLHDHSRHMLSIGLWGSYTEELPGGRTQRWRAPWIRFFRATHQHRVLLNTPTCWTLILAWPNSHKSAIIVDGQRMSGSLYQDSQAAANNPEC